VENNLKVIPKESTFRLEQLEFSEEPMRFRLRKIAQCLNVESNSSIEFLRRSTSNECRSVFRITSPEVDLVVKFDLDPCSTYILSSEFDRLCTLYKFSQTAQFFKSVMPVAFSEKGSFLITHFCSGDKIGKEISTSGASLYKDGIYFELGQWMKEFHQSDEVSEKILWPGWIIDEIMTKIDDTAFQVTHDGSSKLIFNTIGRLEKMRDALRGKPVSFVVRHGDINGGNLLRSEAGIFGLDYGQQGFSPIALELSKLLLLDTMSPDIDFDVTPCGISNTALCQVRCGYEEDQIGDDLEFFCLALILRKFVSVPENLFHYSEYQKILYSRLKSRLLQVESFYQ
jgi:hypothetical protein